ncbi:MAG: class I SAM-dependent methyltransferase [Burkholderiaceae bacterium]|nr:class I SAM-dependent methyltransferase [Burkholderiaceae bacterium]
MSMSLAASLPPLQTGVPPHCGMCQSRQLSALGHRDFGDSCNDHFSGMRQFPVHGVAVPYHRCTACGFIFTAAFDAWAPEDFKAHIYNDDYVRADPPFPLARPVRNSQMVASLWWRARGRSKVLDYGGGNGVFARQLCALGLECQSTDAFHGGERPAPGTVFDLVTCFEVIEHVPHAEQAAWFAGMVEYLAPQGTLLLGIELVDAQTRQDDWYIAPRNGHVSLHSSQSLQRLAATQGLHVHHINPEFHLLRRAAAGDWMTA